MTINSRKNPDARISYRRGDMVALVIGVLMAVYAVVWFGKETLERIERERAVVPAQTSAQKAMP